MSEPLPPDVIDDNSMIENDDGSVTIMDMDDEPEVERGFKENLAEILDESYLTRLAVDTLELVKSDREARKERDKQYAEGIKRTGLGDDAPGGADFDGASRVVHPMLAKGCVDFASRAIKELFPAQGPCKTQIIGEQTEAKIERADRKRDFMNWQSTTQIPENRAELERLLSQVPLGGSQYKRWWYDPELKRPRTEAVYIDYVFTPYGVADFYTSPRVAYLQHILPNEYERRIRTKLYRDLKLAPQPQGMAETSDAAEATEKVEGVDPEEIAYNDEGVREEYEIYIDLEIEDDDEAEGKFAPYVMHLDPVHQRILGLYRNWKEGDKGRAKLHWMTEWQFIPWRGGPAVGLAHLIGSMAGAATGALRAIMDAAQIQNFPGALKLKGGRTAGQSIQINPTEMAEIDAPAGVDDIRKLVMAFPFSGPSQVLFNMLEWLTQQAESVVATASEKIADSADMPVGTALALIEHGSINFSAIHARLHTSMKRDLEIQHRLNSEYLDDEEVIEALGELVVYRKDFQGPMDIVPVSDPNIFSEAQRYAQLQSILQLKADQQFAPLFKPDRLLGRALKLLQIQDIEDIANLPKDPKRLGPTDENITVSQADPSPLKVYEDQDDVAHLQVHIHFATSPIYGGNPLIGSAAMPALLQHCKDHLLALYRKHTRASVDAVKTVVRMQGIQMSDDECESRGQAFTDYALAQVLGPIIMPGLQQMQQLVGQFASKPQPNPDVTAREAGETQRKQMELAYFKDRDDKDRAAETERHNQDQLQQAQAAEVAAAIERFQTESTERMGHLATSIQLIRDQQNNGAKQMLAEFQAQQDKQMLVLQAMIKSITEAPETQERQNKGFADAVTPVMQSVTQAIVGMADQQRDFISALASAQDINAGALEAVKNLHAGLQQLHNTVSADRHVQLTVNPDGSKTARSFIQREGQ